MSPAAASFDLRCEWGEHGARTLAPRCDAVVIVDVLSFATSVCVAVERGAVVFPYRWRDASGDAYARERGAMLASKDRRPPTGAYSLSPASLTSIPRGTRLVLPSPNGSTLSLATGATPTFAGCLRNAAAVARAAGRCGRRIAIVPAGERWDDDGSLRPAVEDLIGAGAILSCLPGTRSPEADAAVAAFERARRSGGNLAASLLHCASGRELADRGFEADVALAAQLDVSRCAPRLRGEAYVSDDDHQDEEDREATGETRRRRPDRPGPEAPA